MAIPQQIISAAVGLGGSNRQADVTLVQRLINAVPTFKGGPSPLLAVDGQCGPLTCGAIKRFQFVNLGFGDGRIDPGQQTQQKLLALLDSLGLLAQLLLGQAAAGETDPATGGPQAQANSPLRQKIVDWANMATKGPYGEVYSAAGKGIVSDLDTVALLHNGAHRTVRRGWKNLKAIFDETVAGWTQQHWKIPGYLDGVQLPGRYVPQPAATGQTHVSWCGIFATWCWLKAGKASKWQAGVGPTGAVQVNGHDGIQPGDICVQRGDKTHHFVAVGWPQGDKVQSVNGNSDRQSILEKPMPLSSVVRYYRPE